MTVSSQHEGFVSQNKPPSSWEEATKELFPRPRHCTRHKTSPFPPKQLEVPPRSSSLPQFHTCVKTPTPTRHSRATFDRGGVVLL